jgi:hypothetical protein
MRKRTILIFLLFALIIFSRTAVAQTLLPPAQTGNFYVSNYNADSVAVYDSAGVYLYSFGAAGLNGPRGVVFAPNKKICQTRPVCKYRAGVHCQNNFLSVRVAGKGNRQREHPKG